ncbi:MAG: methylenetetrahydrofolate reductase [NAD(P)H] [Lachnoclostridium sp.]|nr:methylenetetrahydrofolate reductase [NAD(P)H] [Lachnoclostridium sp.]
MIKKLFEIGKPIFSIEVFPPKKTSDIQIIYTALNEFKTLNPAFISVTYGAGGSTSRSTAEIASYIKNDCGIEALAHLTCVSLPDKEALHRYTETLKRSGVQNILALRGDRPKDMPEEQFESRYFPYAADLVATLRQSDDFCIAGACYPEKHPESGTLQEDISHLTYKVEQGLDFLITQLFYINDVFYRYLEQIRTAGIDIPVSAGLMPITSISQVKNIIALSGAALPEDLTQIIEKYKNSPADLKKAGLDYTKNQMDHLLSHGVDGIHLYSMNKVDIAQTILGQ